MPFVSSFPSHLSVRPDAVVRREAFWTSPPSARQRFAVFRHKPPHVCHHAPRLAMHEARPNRWGATLYLVALMFYCRIAQRFCLARRVSVSFSDFLLLTLSSVHQAHINLMHSLLNALHDRWLMPFTSHVLRTRSRPVACIRKVLPRPFLPVGRLY